MNELEKLRKIAGLTQKEASLKFYVKPQTIRKWENGVTTPNVLLWPIVARTYNINEEYLLELCRKNTKPIPDSKTTSVETSGENLQ